MARWMTYRSTLDPQLAPTSTDTALVTTSSDGLKMEKCTAGEYSNSCWKVIWGRSLPAGSEENIIYRHPSAELRAEQTWLQSPQGCGCQIRQCSRTTAALSEQRERSRDRRLGWGQWQAQERAADSASQPMYSIPMWKAHIISQPAWWLPIRIINIMDYALKQI